MSGIWSLLLCIFLFVGALVLAGVLIWFILGRGKCGDDRVIGELDKQAVLKGTTSNGGPRMK